MHSSDGRREKQSEEVRGKKPPLPNYEMLPVGNFHSPALAKYLKYGPNPPTRKFC